ncbi:alpha/beta-type small acid-soluble spore protein [bacterium 210820-DFI.6.37]|nr:alpha/beta-type small acid-soluble spore protein [bacterium 210820-DFI.6.37]
MSMNPNAKAGLKNLKTEVANELGLANYEQTDKGNLTARQNGYVGGYMTKKLVEMAEQQMAGK